jgi:hypothetical protein
MEPDFGTSLTSSSEQAIRVTGAQEEKAHVSSWPIASFRGVSLAPVERMSDHEGIF